MRRQKDTRIAAALGKAIRRRRLELGLSQEGLADVAKLHRTYMGAVERGERNLTIQSLLRIAEALGTSASALLREAEHEVAGGDE